jgi:hypothetical protein
VATYTQSSWLSWLVKVARKDVRARPNPLREVALVGALFLVYKLGRAAADGRVRLANANAIRVLGFEHWLRLPSEVDVQHLLLHSHELVRGINAFYAWVHFPAAATFLVWLYIRRPDDYLFGRRMLAAVTAAALAVHISFPLEPPRLTRGHGFIDTASWLGPAVYGSPAADKISNQYAAMPSLHVGWALVIAVVLMHGSRSRWRLAWLAYPATTTIVVVGTANHYWLDAIAALILVTVAYSIFQPAGRRRSPSATPLAPAPRPIPPAEQTHPSYATTAMIALPEKLPRRSEVTSLPTGPPA